MINLLKKNFRFGCCVLSLPLMLVIFFGSLGYVDYPYIGSVVFSLCVSLTLLPFFLMRGRGWVRFFKSLGYILAVFVVVVLIIPANAGRVSTPENIGEGLAVQWDQMKYKAGNASLSLHRFYLRPYRFDVKQSRYERISDDAALFTYADPPVALLISTAKDDPHCSGYPRTAAESCTRALSRMSKERTGQVAGQ